MPAVKLQKFLGIAPKISPELLPEGAGQIAYNVQLYSGDILPYHETKEIDNTVRSGKILTLHGLYNPVGGAIEWLSWLTDVDVATPSDSSDDEQRFYYTGDGVPKVSTFAKTTNGSEPYPKDFYELGLPLPTAQPTSSAASFSVSTSESYQRDSGNEAKIITQASHGLRTGNIVTVRDFTGSPALGFNTVKAFVTVTADDTFTYFNSGDSESLTADTNGKVELAGTTRSITHVYTWFTPWGEESIASEPSEALFVKEGQTLTIAGLPTGPPSGTNFVLGMRLYRSVTSVAGTAFFRLATLWFPRTTATVARASNIVTMAFDNHHNLVKDDRFKVSGCSDATFNITGGIVLTVVDDLTITFAQTDSNVSSKAETSGTMFHDVAEVVDDSARYYGDANDDFIDDFDVFGLLNSLATDNYDKPDPSMVGIVIAQNEIVAGFFDNQLCFAEKNKPHAWPEIFRKTIEHDIVAIEPIGGYILVLTDEFAYRVSGNDPAIMSVARIDTPYPCLSKRSVVNMGYGVIWATHGGLAIWSPTTGIVLVTQFLQYWDTWRDFLDPSTITATFHDDKYFATYDGGSFIFERDERIGGYFVTTGVDFGATWKDPITDYLYFTSDGVGTISQWDEPDSTLIPMEWKSKVLVTKDYKNLGAARVIADFPLDGDATQAIIDFNLTVPGLNTAIWADNVQLAPLNGPSDYLDGAIRINVLGGVNSYILNGDPVTVNLKTVVGEFPVTFKLWVDKLLIFTATITSSAIFRMPTGYKSDTFEVGVAGSARVRSIHIGETPTGLRDI